MIYAPSNSKDPYYNLAFEEYLFQQAAPGETYFSLWQNDNTIVIGKNQNPYNEIDADFVKEKEITVVRRITGGGAVYHDLGNVNFTFIAPVEDQSVFDFAKFTEPVIAALRSLGLPAENQGRNDIAIDGAKISGNAQHVSGGKLLHHGTLLFDSNLEMLGKCLTVLPEKLAAKGITSIRSRVTNIRKLLQPGNDLEVDAFIDRLREFVFSLNPGCTNWSPSKADLEAIRALRNNKYATWAWNYGSSPVGDTVYSRRFEGCGTITLRLAIAAGRIAQCSISGDFFGSGQIADIEELLTGVKNEPEAVAEALKDIKLAHYFYGLEKTDFIKLFEGA